MKFLRRLEANASPAPWTTRPTADAGRAELVAADAGLVERDLPNAVAEYLALLRNAAFSLCAGAAVARDAADMIADRLEEAEAAAVGAWLFTARCPDGPTFFLHNSAVRMGTGALSGADAALFEASKATVMPRLRGRRSGWLQSSRARRRRWLSSTTPSSAAKPIWEHVRAEYAAFAAADQPLHRLSGRHGLPERTLVMAKVVAERMDLANEGLRVLDIGCGDATLLKMLPSSCDGAGTVVSTAERERLEATPELARFTFRTVRFQDLSSIPGPFDRVVVNGSLHFIGSDAAAQGVLVEIGRLTASGGIVWIGEMLVRPLVLSSPDDGEWRVTPRRLRTRACGLHLQHVWSCQALTEDSFYGLQDRWSCRLARRGQRAGVS